MLRAHGSPSLTVFHFLAALPESRRACLIRVPPPNIAHETVTVGHETVTSQLSGAETASAMIRAPVGFQRSVWEFVFWWWVWVDLSTDIQVHPMMFDVHLQAVPIPIDLR